MENNERELICYKLLAEVFIENAYGSIQLNSHLNSVTSERDKAYISNLFYGILEKNVQLDYIISQLVNKAPKTSVKILIKLGLYRMRYMATPSYAAINETVGLCKRVGKVGVSGFVNAVLRKSETVQLPIEGELPEASYLSIFYSVPLWLSKKLISQYGYDFAKQFLAAPISKKTHIRHNSRVITKKDFEEKLPKSEREKSKFGYYVTHNMLKNLKRDTFTVQSLSSMIAVQSYITNKDGELSVLDLCGAPGGKSVYLEELCSTNELICCDKYPHRVELIKKYVTRMKSGVVPTLSDATAICPEWFGKFDLVICDVPCTGIGVYKSKPDVLLNKKPEDVIAIKGLQLSILENAKNYLKVGGCLCYSTCTVFKEENDDNINDFLKANENFVLDKIENEYASEDGMVRLFPNEIEGCDGFFVARLRRVK
ncbi:MAG: 16S rRNA (cytosine(967)-C(5))-methyltransferase RsmB [Clostridia bacterium]|nr:16S rRNA (cytosine(967)-C(5))-methyltransferase RsmB [Clostridia bacterium]